MNKDFFQFGNKSRTDSNIKGKPAFTQPIDQLAPGEKLVFGLAQGPVIFGTDASSELTPQQFTISASYGFCNTRVSEEHQIDLRPYFGSEGDRDPVVEELERLRKAIEQK